MGLRLNRNTGTAANLSPGEWCVDDHVTISCPACGGIAWLDDRHYVDHGGLVTPAFACPTETCSFFEWITLGGYGEAS